MGTVNSAETRSAAIADLYAGRSVKQVCRKYDLNVQAINAWKRFGYYRPNGNGTPAVTTNGNGNSGPKLTLMERMAAIEKRVDDTYERSLNAAEKTDAIAREIGLGS